MADDYEIWSVEGKPVSVHLRTSVAGHIRAMANATPEGRPEIETGGVLWGRFRQGAENYYIVSIEKADLLDCDHTRGEAWVLSDRDRRALRKRMNQRQGDLQAVGYWRSHRRLGLYLDNRDFDLMTGFFVQPWCVALCVRPPATGGFFFWEEGDIRRTSSYRELQLPDAGQPAIVPPPVEPRRWQRWAIAASVATALTTAPFLLKSRGTDGSAFNMLSMKADVASGTVRLHWDPNSKVLQQNNGATMWIADGPDESKLELSAQQVRAGSLEYKAISPDVNFRMEVGQFSESLRVSSGAPPIEHASVNLPASYPAAGQPVQLPAVSVGPPSQPAAARSVAAAQSEDSPKPGTESKRKKRKKHAPPPLASADEIARLAPRPTAERSREVDVPQPPQLHLGPTQLKEAPVPHGSIQVPKVMASVEKPHASPLKRALGWMIPNRKKEFVPAKAVKQVQPSAKVEQDTSVAVRVSIDQKGIVQEADLLTKGVDDHLARSVVEAAKRWRFEPARMDDQPVASNLVVRFQFGTDP